jgi:hypothetical protein
MMSALPRGASRGIAARCLPSGVSPPWPPTARAPRDVNLSSAASTSACLGGVSRHPSTTGSGGAVLPAGKEQKGGGHDMQRGGVRTLL